MRNIFLLAKHQAYKENSNQIHTNHIKTALSGLEILDNKAKKVIFSLLDIADIIPAPLFNTEDIKKAEIEPPIEYSQEVFEFTQQLKSYQLSLGSNISKLFFVSQNNLKQMQKKFRF